MFHRSKWLGLSAIALLLISSGGLCAQAGKSRTPVGDPYPLDKCVVSGEKLDTMGKPFVHEHAGREVKFCCKGCLPKFTKDPKKYLDRMDSEVARKQLRHYPLKTCVVSGEALDSKAMKPVNWVYNNRLVRLYCPRCKKDFEKSPAQYLKKLDEAVVAAQTEHYPTKKCLVSGKDLGSMGEPADCVVANRLIRLCCAGCKEKARAESRKYLSMLDAKVKERRKDR